MQGLPLRCYNQTNGIIGCAIQFRNTFLGLGGPTLKPGGVMAKKPLFFTYAGPSPEVLQPNQWYHRMRNLIPQHLFGVRGVILKTGGSYGQKTTFFHLCRAFP